MNGRSIIGGKFGSMVYILGPISLPHGSMISTLSGLGIGVLVSTSFEMILPVVTVLVSITYVDVVPEFYSELPL